MPIGEVAPVDRQAVLQAVDVVERPAGGSSDEHVHLGTELDQRVSDVRTHEPVRTRDEHGASGELSEIAMKGLKILLAPHAVLSAHHHLLDRGLNTCLSCSDLIQ